MQVGDLVNGGSDSFGIVIKLDHKNKGVLCVWYDGDVSWCALNHVVKAVCDPKTKPDKN